MIVIANECLFPIIYLSQNRTSVTLFVNAYYVGIDRIYYNKYGDNDHVHEQVITSPIAKIKLFPEGKGLYEFYLKDGAPIHVYIPLDKDEETIEKIISHIKSPINLDYIKDKTQLIEDISRSYVEALVDEYKKIKNIQEFELKAWVQIIATAERYENARASVSNHDSLGDCLVYYGPKLRIKPAAHITSIEVYQLIKEDNELKRKPYRSFFGEAEILFAPDALYEINLYSDADLTCSFIHYQFNDAGTSYLWSIQNELNKREEEIRADISIDVDDVEISSEDKERIITEIIKNSSNKLLIPYPTATPHELTNLMITIPLWNKLKAFKKPFYLSIKELDQFDDETFEKRYELSGAQLIIDCAKECISDEIIMYVEDEKGTIVSEFGRYSPLRNMSEYHSLRELINVNNYTKTFLSNFETQFGSGSYFSSISSIILALKNDPLTSIWSLPRSLLIDTLRDVELLREQGEFVFFITDDRFNRISTNQNLFNLDKPIFYYNENRIVFPPKVDNYVLCVERHLVDRDEPSLEFISSSSSRAQTVSLLGADLVLLYCIDATTYQNSGFIVFNTQKKEYYSNNLLFEVITHG